MHSKTETRKFVQFALFFLIIVSLIFTPALANQNASASGTVPKEISDLLSDYSQNLENLADKRILQSAYYSSEMEMLIIDRQNYYEEFFEKGLHSHLVGLDSQFKTEEGFTISWKGNSNKVHIIEEVTMHGNPIITSPDDYPLIQAAEWAINQTSNGDIINHLNQYIESMIKGVEESVNDGVLIVFLVNHDMEISVENGRAKILKDTFSDKSSDNGEGFDNVTWTENQFTRLEPDWQKMLDYQMYNVPIETIGENLLKDYEAVTKTGIMALESPNNSSNTNRDHAVWYIQYYTSNPTPMHLCPDGTTLVYRDSAFYNATYSPIWSAPELECNDCADYVSQSLHYGGFPTDDTWKAESTNLAWTQVIAFKDYFSDPTKNRGSWASSLASLTPGDVVFVYDSYYADPWRHVVMYSSINPSRYSAHTNDRLNYTFSPVLNRFLVINYYQSIFLPIIIKFPSKNLFIQGFIQNPYPAP